MENRPEIPRTVGNAAELLGVTVRTLHHWDAIGLLQPSERSFAGYRVYSSADIERGQQVLIYRETGMSLDEIADVLDATSDAGAHLAEQRRRLLQRIEQLEAMVAAVDEILGHDMDTTKKPLTVEEKAAILGNQWPVYEREAEENWGETEDWKVSDERQASLDVDGWRAVKDELEDLEARLADAAARGVVPGSDEANALAEEHRANLSQWFDVSHSKHTLIARSYVADPNFTAHYDERREGLAAWVKDIIDANARAHGVAPDKAEWT